MKKPESEFYKHRFECIDCYRIQWRQRYDRRKGTHADISHKICRLCKRDLPISEFASRPMSSDGYSNECRKCTSDRVRQWRYKTHRHNPDAWNIRLGCCIGERVVAEWLDSPEVMPANNPGFDLRCKNGYTIEVKSSLFRPKKGIWTWKVNRNLVCDYFVLLAFGETRDAELEHVWMIPAGARMRRGAPLQSHVTFTIYKSRIDEFRQYEKPLPRAGGREVTP